MHFSKLESSMTDSQYPQHNFLDENEWETCNTNNNIFILEKVKTESSKFVLQTFFLLLRFSFIMFIPFELLAFEVMVYNVQYLKSI